ncbi:MAG: hypothetical protein M1838_000102 [Thelocarpon superellum]|nr:MAG: hypothetical protein M1838_000102 [Thelocarpon superellum]
MPNYELRAGGDANQMKNKKQSMADLKLRRLTELNLRLREDLDRPRVKVSEAAMGLINYTSSTKDFMVPQVWGPVSIIPILLPPEALPRLKRRATDEDDLRQQVDRREDPYAPQSNDKCCTIM